MNCGAIGVSTQQERARLDSVRTRFVPNVVLLSVAPDDDRAATDEDWRPTGGSPDAWQRLFRTWALITTLRRPDPVPPDYASIVEGIRQLDADVRDGGGRLAVVLLQYRRAPEWAGLDSAVTEGLRTTSIPVLDLGPTLLPFGEQQLLVHSKVDWHPNELAHRLSAEAIRKFLADHALLDEAADAGEAASDSGARSPATSGGSGGPPRPRQQ